MIVLQNGFSACVDWERQVCPRTAYRRLHASGTTSADYG